jgi:hypothetical protein
MHYTREPIIETVITPREGCKLLIRNSKNEDRQEYYVEALEVVSFGHSFFFRSTERPSAFLVPATDYEVLELKEMRMPLKLGASEKPNKTGQPSLRPQQREAVEEPHEEVSAGAPESASERFEKKRGDRRRGRRRRGGGSRASADSSSEGIESEEILLSESIEGAPKIQGVETGSEAAAPFFISKLFPPPPTLIKETLSRYKINEDGGAILEEKNPLPEDEFPDVDHKTKLED